jgi:2-polyprenyl-3-methyl-5-hydroxy-6-metoxy-1,4-benzoquinol methylase
MSSCCSSFCTASQRQFSAAIARRDLALYRKRGPDVTTRLLRDAILHAGSGSSVLDIGAGIGALSFELLAAGVTRATTVDAAPAYLAAAREEAGRRDFADRFEQIHGDFVSVARDIAPADIVTMDRVVCCYPAYQPLLEAALGRSRRLFAFSYPRDRWYVRAVIALQNLVRAVMRNPFRSFVHPAQDMERLLQRHGFTRLERRETIVWSADLYGRANAA